MKNLRLEALFVAVGLIVVGICICHGLSGIGDNHRIVNVKGLAEREVEANKVTWPLIIKTLGNDLNSIYDEVNKSNTITQNFLISKGISADEISINAPQIIDKEADIYNSQPVTYRYNVTSVITVSSNKVDLVRKLMSQQGELLKQGVAVSANDYSNAVIYEYTGLNQIKPEMIEQATQNAREVAEKFAKDSKSTLGKIMSANQGLFSIDNRDANTPYIKRVRVVTTINYFLDD